MISRVLYGAVFIVFLPVLLVLWAHATAGQITLPVPEPAWIGWIVAALGLAFTAVGMIALWTRGGGLPMNAFPPPRFVESGLYRWIPHPIYTGFSLLCGGVAISTQSSSGFWLITPVVVAGCAALVLGYERIDLRNRFGDAVVRVRLLPAGSLDRPTGADRARFYLFVLLPWLALYFIVTVAGVLPGARDLSMGSERDWPVWPWTFGVYMSSYVVTPLAPWLARSSRDLRRLSVSAWMAMAVAYPAFFIFPVLGPHRAIAPGLLRPALALEQSYYLDTAALPAFHVIWACLLVTTLLQTGVAKWTGRIWAMAIAIACVTTGMHNILDVMAAFLLSVAILHVQTVWEFLRAATERMANSWREWRIGPVRVMNHSIYAALAAGSGVLIASLFLGPGHARELAATAAAGLIGAGLWAQLIEGSPRLLRPFGFYGGLFGILLVSFLFSNPWELVAGYCVAAPFVQSIGRLRCLVQGCCHGSPAPGRTAIRCSEPHSRISGDNLAGVPIHPTPLYSILWNVVVGAIMLRLWSIGASYTMIVGLYAIVSSVGRFVEEAYRGEPQTPVLGGMRLYQWIAIGMVLLGAVITCIPSAHGLFAPQVDIDSTILAVVFGLVAGAALGVDFPGSNRRFSRLAPE